MRNKPKIIKDKLKDKIFRDKLKDKVIRDIWALSEAEEKKKGSNYRKRKNIMKD